LSVFRLSSPRSLNWLAFLEIVRSVHPRRVTSRPSSFFGIVAASVVAAFLLRQSRFLLLMLGLFLGTTSHSSHSSHARLGMENGLSTLIPSYLIAKFLHRRS